MAHQDEFFDTRFLGSLRCLGPCAVAPADVALINPGIDDLAPASGAILGIAALERM